MQTETGIGAGWAHSGSLPPWMEQRPGFDEAEAADCEQDLAAFASVLAAALRPVLAVALAAALRAELLAERFGPPAALVAEDPADYPATWAHRRAVLDAGMYPPVGRGRRGLVVPAAHPTEDHIPAAVSRRAA